MSGLNGPPVLNGGSNDYDRDICFDAPVEMDTGLYAQRGKTLKQLRDELMIRLGFAAMVANPPPGMTELLNSFLNDAQDDLYTRYDCLRTERWWAWQLQPGQRLYDTPIDCTKALNTRKLRWVGIADNGGRALSRWAANKAYGLQTFVMSRAATTGFDYECTTAGTSGAIEPVWPTVLNGTVADGTAVWTARGKLAYTWYPMWQGINPIYYSTPNQGMPTNFDVREYIEVYPAPEKPYVLQILGHMGIQRFAEDGDYCTIDPAPLFLFALANAKAHYRQPDAGNYASRAQRMALSLTAQQHGLKKRVQRVSTGGKKWPLNGMDEYHGPWPQPRGVWRP